MTNQKPKLLTLIIVVALVVAFLLTLIFAAKFNLEVIVFLKPPGTFIIQIHKVTERKKKRKLVRIKY